MTTQTEQLWGLIEPYLAAERLELDDLELVGQGRGRVLRVFVDGENLTIDRLVSSPGLERKLKRPAHYMKSIGREVVVKLDRDGKTVTRRGILTAATDDRFTIAGEGGESTVEYSEVKSARTVFRLEKAPKPGHKE
jgi:ribosome maturation factor RimP